MVAQRFDTLDFSNELKEVGVNEKQAEVYAHGVARAINENVCTKSDLRDLESRFELKLKELELKIAALELKIAALELKISSLIGRSATTIIFILGGLQTLFHFYPK